MIDGKVGASAVLIRQGAQDKIAKFHLGTDTEHEVYKAEIIGLQLALHLLAQEREAKRVDIYVDNQAVVRTLTAKKTNNLTHMFIQLEKLLNYVTHRFVYLEICTRWILGHVDVEGNEKADKAAKEAAGENQEDREGNND